jgi:hypothetical protein
MTRLRVDAAAHATTAGLPARALAFHQRRSLTMTLGTILLIILVLMLIGAIPNWGYSRGWGYGPSGIVGVILVVVLVLVLMGRV